MRRIFDIREFLEQEKKSYKITREIPLTIDEQRKRGKKKKRKWKNYVKKKSHWGLTKTAIATVEVTLVGVDDTITAAHWLVLFRAETRARTALPGRPGTSCVSTYINKKRKNKNTRIRKTLNPF